MVHFNSRSLYANFQFIKAYIAQFNQPFDVIAISETWINTGKEEDFEMKGYELLHLDRTNKKGGGVALYVDKNLRFEKMSRMTRVVDGVMECITVEINMNKQKNIIVSCIYRTPGSKIETFKDIMEDLYTNLNQKRIFICGDFNIDLLNPNHNKSTEEFIESMYCMGLFPLITRPTRITTHGATLLDNIFTNVMEENIKAGILINDISDHLPVFVTYDCCYKVHRNVGKMIYKTIRTEKAMQCLKNELIKQDWTIVYKHKDVNKAYEAFLSIFMALLEKNSLLIEVNRKDKYTGRPWMTKGLQNACKKKNSLYREFIKKRTTESEKKYKKYKNKLTNIMRTCKKEYFIKKLEDNKDSMKGIWNVLNSIIKNAPRTNDYPGYFMEGTNTISKMNEVVDGFNDFFVHIGPKLAAEIKVDMIERETGGNIERNASSMFLRAVEEKEIYDIVSGLKNKTSTDFHDIDMLTVKRVIDGIVKPLQYIFNLSFQEGVFPQKMKVAKIIPIYKSGEKHCFTNYRPVSVLCQFSKILEKLFLKRLDNFVEKHDLLANCQYGFRNNRSTVLALMDLMEEITECMDNKKYALGVFLDLKKAFDTVDHKILIIKLEKYGFRGVVLDWIKSYVMNRQQYVQINEFKSKLMDIECGVPQGSVLGPKLFIMYINDICKVSKILKFVIFADDTNILCSSGEFQQVVEVITQELKILKTWFDRNKLSLNLNKTKFMLFGNHKKDINIEICVDNVYLERVNTIKFLGVIIDHKACWKSHITYVRGKLARGIAVLGKVKHFLDRKTLYMLYCAFILPYMSYCVEVWGNTYKSNIQTIIIMQKRAIRLINQEGYRAHTNALFIKTQALKFQDLVKFKTVQIIYKVRKGMLPIEISKWFLEREGRYNFRGKWNLKVQRVRTTLKRMSISIAGVKFWNELTEEIKDSSNVNQFKIKLKKEMLNKYKNEENAINPGRHAN
uniref:Reverse transcriptase domain-containing protein n=1 Tax=Nothobranchius furzeri TaxID=105023 RepID=A0A8C6M4T9_NOTFU